MTITRAIFSGLKNLTGRVHRLDEFVSQGAPRSFWRFDLILDMMDIWINGRVWLMEKRESSGSWKLVPTFDSAESLGISGYLRLAIGAVEHQNRRLTNT